MDALAALLDKYVETFFVGFLLVIPIILIANGRIPLRKYNEAISLFFELGSTHQNVQTIKISFVFLAIFSCGLFFKSITFWIFEDVHEKVIAYTECKPRIIDDMPDIASECKCKDSDYSQFELSRRDFFLGLLGNTNKTFTDCRMKIYLSHLPKQAKWFINQPQSYRERVESLERNITVSQGLMFSSVMAIATSGLRLIEPLIRLICLTGIFMFQLLHIRIDQNGEIKTVKTVKTILQMLLYILCGTALYILSFRTWWALEERYHTRIYVAEQFVNKPPKPEKEDG